MTLCEQIRDDLKAYSDGELPVMARLRVRRHVSQCAACREEINAMELIRRRLRQNDAPTFTPELKDKILAGIPEGVPPTDETLPVRNKKKPLMIFGTTAAAALCWFTFYPMTQGSPEMAGQSVSNMKSLGTANTMYVQDYDEQAKTMAGGASTASGAGAGIVADSAFANEAVSATAPKCRGKQKNRE